MKKSSILICIAFSLLIISIFYIFCYDDNFITLAPIQTRNQPTDPATIDETPPEILSITPEDGSYIAPHKTITIQFTETMNITSLDLSGDLASECVEIPDWEYVTERNDTVILSSDAGWNVGDGRTIIIDCEDVAGNPLETTTLTYSVENTPPTPINIDPPDETFINNATQIIRVTFSETLDRSSLKITGNLSDEYRGAEWLTVNETDDTIDLGPLGVWSEGDDRYFFIDGTDLAGNEMETVELKYGFDYNPPFPDVTPPNGTQLNVNESILIDFGEAIDTSTLVFSEDMAALFSDGGLSFTEIEPGVYESGDLIYKDDFTLTISPSVVWDVGNHSLGFMAEDTYGNSMGVPMVLNYDIKYILTVDDGTDGGGNEDVGQFSSIAADASNIYIAYYNVTTDDILFARSVDNGETWTKYPTGVTSDGMSQKGISLACAGANVYLSYYDGSSDTLKFIRSIDNGATWGAAVTIDATAGTGSFNAIATDGSGNVFAAYYDSINGDLKYAESNNHGGAWSTQTIDHEGISGSINTGKWTSIVENGGNVYISYYDAKNEDLMMIMNDGSWSTPLTVDTGSNMTGISTSIGFDSNTVYISYTDVDSPKDLKLAEVDVSAAPSVSNLVVVDTGDGDVGDWSSLTISGGDIHISYFDGKNSDLKYAYHPSASAIGSDWEVQTIELTQSPEIAGEYTSIAVNGSNVYISYYQHSYGNLHFARSVDGGTTW